MPLEYSFWLVLKKSVGRKDVELSKFLGLKQIPLVQSEQTLVDLTDPYDPITVMKVIKFIQISLPFLMRSWMINLRKLPKILFLLLWQILSFIEFL